MFAAVHIPDFPLEAVMRAEPALRDQSLAVLDGKPPLLTVLAVNEKAGAAGVETGMTAVEAAAGVPGLELRRRSPLQEAAAHAALLDCARAFSPRVEDTAADTAVVDIAGLELLFGAPPRIARELAHRASELGLETNVAVAGNADAAVHAARGFPGVTVIPAGHEAERLGDLPIDVLWGAGACAGDSAEDACATPELLETLDRWGVRTFRALAALPEVAVTERLGQHGLELQRLARGATQRTIVPAGEPQTFEEGMELEHPVEMLEPLAFILGRLLEQLCARLGTRALATNELRLQLELDNTSARETPNAKHEATIRLPVPMLDSKIFLKLLQLELKSHPPQAPVTRVALTAEPVRPRCVQGGLFLPAAPAPERLEVVLARLRGISGEDRVGSAELLDTYRPDAFRMRRFAPPSPASAGSGEGNPRVDRAPMMALRRLRPPARATVELNGGRPARLWTSDQALRGEVVTCSGPWRSSGEWWQEAPGTGAQETPGWTREEWDVAVTGASGIVLCRIFFDHATDRWFVEGTYD